jgi:hypothetical protein
MELSLAYADIRKMATMFRQPGIAVTDCCYGGEHNVQINVRGDLAQHVPMVSKVTKSAPLTALLWLSISNDGPDHLLVKLDGMDLDKSELPLLMRTFVSEKMVRKQLFEMKSPDEAVVIDVETESFRVDAKALLTKQGVPLSAALGSCTVTEDGLLLEAALGYSPAAD